MNSDAKTTATAAAAEPGFRLTPVPVLLFLLIGLLVYLGQLYLDQYGGGFHAKVYGPYDSWKMVQDLQPKGADDLVFAKGKKVYNDMGCAACHQANGLGTPGQFPPLAGSEWVLAPGPNRMIRIIQNGLEGPIKVNGVDWSLAMPGGLGAILSDEDFAALLTYIRGNKEWGNNASLITPEQVKAAREQFQGRQTPWRAEELLAIPEN
jgi:mono/diheme cytochrome c family protein